MRSIAETVTTKLEAAERELRLVQNHHELMTVVLRMSDHPLWKDYRRTLDARVKILADQVLAVRPQEVAIDVHDRERAEAAAQAREIHMIATAPERFSLEAPRLAARIEDLENQISTMRAKYQFLQEKGEAHV